MLFNDHELVVYTHLLISCYVGIAKEVSLGNVTAVQCHSYKQTVLVISNAKHLDKFGLFERKQHILSLVCDYLTLHAEFRPNSSS